MSKAFTSEGDDAENVLTPPPLPPGMKNYMTPQGAARLVGEIQKLQDEKNRLDPQEPLVRSLREKIDARLTYLVQRFDAVHVIDPGQQPRDRVLFGARVTVRDAAGHQGVWRIVGVDEMDLDKGDISWASPLATALLDRQVNDRIPFLERILTVLDIQYPC